MYSIIIIIFPSHGISGKFVVLLSVAFLVLFCCKYIHTFTHLSSLLLLWHQNHWFLLISFYLKETLGETERKCLLLYHLAILYFTILLTWMYVEIYFYSSIVRLFISLRVNIFFLVGLDPVCSVLSKQQCVE